MTGDEEATRKKHNVPQQWLSRTYRTLSIFPDVSDQALALAMPPHNDERNPGYDLALRAQGTLYYTIECRFWQ